MMTTTDDALLRRLLGDGAAVIRRGMARLPPETMRLAIEAFRHGGELVVELHPGRPDTRDPPAVVVLCVGADQEWCELFRLGGRRMAEH